MRAPTNSFQHTAPSAHYKFVLSQPNSFIHCIHVIYSLPPCENPIADNYHHHFQTNQSAQFSEFNNYTQKTHNGKRRHGAIHLLHKTAQDRTVTIRRVSVSMAAQHSSHAECNTLKNDVLHNSNVKHLCRCTSLYVW
jgi:hypothetical protein